MNQQSFSSYTLWRLFILHTAMGDVCEVLVPDRRPDAASWENRCDVRSAAPGETQADLPRAKSVVHP